MDSAANTVAIRNSYKALMAACMKANSGLTAETFNRRVEGMIHEIADGEAPNYSPAMYLRAAEEVAYYDYSVNFRNVLGCA